MVLFLGTQGNKDLLFLVLARKIHQKLKEMGKMMSLSKYKGRWRGRRTRTQLHIRRRFRELPRLAVEGTLL